MDECDTVVSAYTKCIDTYNSIALTHRYTQCILSGAICYSELGTLVQKSGGEYAYIMETLGPIPGFLFAWTSVIVVRTSSIAIVCLTFAEYMTELLPICGVAQVPTKLVAAASIGNKFVLSVFFFFFNKLE